MLYSPNPHQPITPNEMRQLITTYIDKSQSDCSIVEIDNYKSIDECNQKKELFLQEFNKLAKSAKENQIILLYDKNFETWSTLCLKKTNHGNISVYHIPSINNNQQKDYKDQNSKPYTDLFLNYALKNINIETQLKNCSLLREGFQQESGHLALFNAFLISQGEKINDKIFDNNDKPDYSYQDFSNEVQRKRNTATRSIPNNNQRFPQFNHNLSVTKTPPIFLNQANSSNSNNLDYLLKIQKEAIKKHISQDCSEEEMESRKKLLDERFTSKNYPKNKKYITALVSDPSLINRGSFLRSFFYKIDLPSFLTKSSTQNTR